VLREEVVKVLEEVGLVHLELHRGGGGIGQYLFKGVIWIFSMSREMLDRLDWISKKRKTQCGRKATGAPQKKKGAFGGSPVVRWTNQIEASHLRTVEYISCVLILWFN